MRTARKRPERRRTLVYGVAAVLVLCVILAILLRPPSLEQVARRGLAAVQSRDAGLLLSNLTPNEVQELKLDRGSVDRFLVLFVWRRLAGFSPSGQPRIEALPDTGQLLAHQDYAHPDGRRITIDISTAATPDGPKITSAIASLTLCVLAASLPPGQSLPGGRARHAFWGAALRGALPDLQSTGVRGLLSHGTKSGSDELYNFEQFAERSERLGAVPPTYDAPDL